MSELSHSRQKNMAFRRAVVPNVGTSTRLLGRTSISSGRSSNTRLMQAARLHGRAVPTASARLATASEAGGAPGSRGFASAVPVDEGISDSAGQVNSNTRFFRPVEKLDNGVAIIRCVVRSGGAARPCLTSDRSTVMGPLCAHPCL